MIFSSLPSFTVRRTVPLVLAAVASAAVAASALAQTKMIEPTKEELAMTSLPGYPGVSAVVLNEEELTKDDMHSDTHYRRVKILTEDGKKYANVELPYVDLTEDSEYGSMQSTQDDIHGRTIHPDGTVVPFTGKPYIKLIEKEKGVKVREKIFTLPDVTVGSIIEYSYATRIDDYHYGAPTWVIQGDLYVKSAHYMWYPTAHLMQDETGALIQTISWFPLLPKGAEIVHHELPGAGPNGNNQMTYELTVHDVPPVVTEEFMPPISNFTYRVYFNYISEHDAAEFWKTEGKAWSKRVNTFANPNGDLKDATQKIIAGASTSDQKLRAIYAAVMALENTDYTRAHQKREDKANGLAQAKNAADVLHNQRGTSDQLAYLFIGMARAAGFQAEAMRVPDLSRDVFVKEWLNLQQLSDAIAVVNVDGKEQFFDPGARYCPFEHLAWQHSFTQGLRQKGNETAFENTSGDGYNDNKRTRVAVLKMDETGHMTGQISFTYVGATALRWRHVALRGDDESLKHELRTALEEMIPRSLEVKDVTVANVADYEQPLKVTYNVEGSLGTVTGKRLLLPADLFLANEKATFPHDKREIAIDFRYPEHVVDAQRIIFPSSFSIEAVPSHAKFNFAKAGAYGMVVDQSPTFFTTHREYEFAEILVLPAEYTQLRTFYSQMEANDQQPVILKAAAPIVTSASSSAATAAN